MISCVNKLITDKQTTLGTMSYFIRRMDELRDKIKQNPSMMFPAFVDKKQKELIYVGRLDFVQKRVYRVIDTWNYLEERFPDWHLTIVGDGEDRQNLENHVKCLGLKRVSFEGFQKPVEYYKRASILLLTSDFEGFPLVLAECMSFGVIPVVYNSYSAVGDIIDDCKDGIVIPYHKDGYKADEAAGLVAQVMSDDVKRENTALAAIGKSEEYSVERIYAEWERVFEKIKQDIL